MHPPGKLAECSVAERSEREMSYLVLHNVRVRQWLRLFLFQNILTSIAVWRELLTFQSAITQKKFLSSTFAHTTFLHLAFPLISSFLILSGLVTTHPSSTISNFFSCAFFTVHVSVSSAHVSAPYIIAGLTAILYYSSGYSLKLVHKGLSSQWLNYNHRWY